MADYEPIVGWSAVEELRQLGARLGGKRVLNVNSTPSGGGVAEILARMMPLLVQLGVDARWEIFQGSEEFFKVTKKLHNALHGWQEEVTAEDLSLFTEVSRRNLVQMQLDGDVVFIHDPQPMALVEKKREVGKLWLWRCHIDVSRPDPRIWDFVRRYVVKYDGAVFSAPSFVQQLPIRQFLISPSIDPLSDKNRELAPSTIDSVLERYSVPRDKPIITQVSRFDYLKDPVGVIEAFRMVKRSIDCRLVLAGGTAVDDPESEKVLSEVKEKAEGAPDVHILPLPPGSDIEINALQRASAVVLQKSLKEGFGLTVSEALWKGKPVVASAVGGIPLQVMNRITGLLSHGVEGTAYAIRQLLANPEYARSLGERGREHVRHNFLITRHLKEYLMMFLAAGRREEVIYL